MNPVSDSYLLSLKLTPEQYRWIENAARFVEVETGCKVAHSSIVLRLMDYGAAQFERELEELRARSNQGRKRFGRLQLVYTRLDSPKA